jgi:hypothetical protein
MIQFTINLPGTILLETSLSFLGPRVQPAHDLVGAECWAMAATTCCRRPDRRGAGLTISIYPLNLDPRRLARITGPEPQMT